MDSLDQELRFYCFVNFYLSSIQQGIQTGHCAVDLVMKYLDAGGAASAEVTPEKAEMVRRWAASYKTFIILNGGDAENIEELERVIAAAGDFPFATFHESESALKGLMTCVGVALPETVFDVKPVVRPDGVLTYVYQKSDETGAVIASRTYGPGHPHYELVKALKSCGLAR